jgi:hypothetical protein
MADIFDFAGVVAVFSDASAVKAHRRDAKSEWDPGFFRVHRAGSAAAAP